MSLPPRQRLHPAPHLTPLVVLLSVMLLSALLSALVGYFVAEQQRARFQREVASFDASLTRRLDNYLNVMVAARALWSTGADIDRATFRRYVTDLNLSERLPGARSLGFARWITPGLLETFETDQRRGLPDFTVHPRSGAVSVPVTFFEPDTASTRVALGYDMYSDPVRRRRHRRGQAHQPAQRQRRSPFGQ